MTETDDRWVTGTTYEDFMGRWSRLAAETFVAWLPASSRLSWLDVGCGTGFSSAAMLRRFDVSELVGVDPADQLAYGAYLAGPLGHCIECHTPMGPKGPDFRNALQTQRVCDAVLASAEEGSWKDTGAEL